MLHALLLGAALLAVAPLDTRHAALLDALSSDHGGMSCSPAELRAAAADATIQSVGRVDGDDVVVAHLNGGCLCGAHNCPVYALISNEETYAYRGGRYVDIENARVRGDTGTRKPNVTVRFAPGASSAQLHGSASRDWDDAYTFDAEKGQVLNISSVSSRGSVAMNLFGPRDGVTSMSDGMPATLPATGTYVLRVRPAAEQAVPSALELSITSAAANAAPAPTAQPVPGAR